MSQMKPKLKPFDRHIVFCVGEKCSGPGIAMPLYQYLKQRLKELALERPDVGVIRSQCQCLQVCQGGPLAVVYPDNVWYCGLDQEKVERILQEHLLGGKAIPEYAFYPDSICSTD